MLVPLHAGLAANHEAIDRLLAAVFVGGLWLAATGFAERRSRVTTSGCRKRWWG